MTRQLFCRAGQRVKFGDQLIMRRTPADDLVVRWFTANIGVHHTHHLRSRITYYRLPLVLRDYSELGVFGRLTLIQSFRCVRLVLWDEGQQRLVSVP